MAPNAGVRRGACLFAWFDGYQAENKSAREYWQDMKEQSPNIRRPRHEMTRELTDVAMGRRPATLVLRNGRWVNVHSAEIIPGIDVAVCGCRIAYVGEDARHTIGPATQVIDAAGRYLLPGLCDAHVHIESGMITLTQFVRAVLPHGTTSLFIDPHEIANVLGARGVWLMLEEAAALPANVYVQMPSCVPSAPGLETPAAEIGPEDVAEAMRRPGIIGLGEVMNFPGVCMNDAKMHGEIAEALKAGKTVGGHYASPDLGLPFHGYAAAGPADDHEGSRVQDIVARVRQGMTAMLRYGSSLCDALEQVKAITELGLDARNMVLCTDDSHSDTLVNYGHVNRVLRALSAKGLAPMTAIRMATLNTAAHFGLERDIGSITPGRYADIVVSSDLSELPIELVVAAGCVAAENGRLIADIPAYEYPAFALDTVRLARPVVAGDFELRVSSGLSRVRARVIGIVERQAATRALEFELPVQDGVVQPDPALDVCRVAVVERHKASGRVANGFVCGLGFNSACAVACSVAHDCHHIIVVGTDAAEMAVAVNRLAETGGGVTVRRQGKELAMVELPIAGLMSAEPAEVVARKVARMGAALKECGCPPGDVYMQITLLALAVIPELRISDLGLVDVAQFKLIEPVIA